MTKEVNALVKASAFDLQTWDDVVAFAKTVSESGMVPDIYKGKHSNCLIAMKMGHDVGLSEIQSLQNIAVINGRPSLWGDSIPGLLKQRTDYQGMKEWTTGNFSDNDYTCHCLIKREGDEDVTNEFSIEDAKRAGLWAKSGPWTKYPKRMLKMRARGWSARDQFPDALLGLSVAEEAMDMPPLDPGAEVKDGVVPPTTAAARVDDVLKRHTDKAEEAESEVVDTDTGEVAKLAKKPEAKPEPEKKPEPAKKTAPKKEAAKKPVAKKEPEKKADTADSKPGPGDPINEEQFAKLTKFVGSTVRAFVKGDDEQRVQVKVISAAIKSLFGIKDIKKIPAGRVDEAQAIVRSWADGQM